MKLGRYWAKVVLFLRPIEAIAEHLVVVVPIVELSSFAAEDKGHPTGNDYGEGKQQGFVTRLHGERIYPDVIYYLR